MYSPSTESVRIAAGSVLDYHYGAKLEFDNGSVFPAECGWCWRGSGCI